MARVLVTGAGGFLGSHIVRRLVDAGHEVCAAFRSAPPPGAGARAVSLDLADDAAISRAFEDCKPEAVIHAAAIADISVCERDPVLAQRINAGATAHLAQLCAVASARLIFLSTDQVFDGAAGPYSEADEPRPLHVYGRTKREAELALIGAGADSVALRVALAYGASPGAERSASEQILRAIERSQRPRLFTDEFRTPVAASDVASAVAELLLRLSAPRLLHLAGPDRVSRHDFGRAVCRAFGLDDGALDPARAADLDLRPPRPCDLSLDTTLAKTVLSAPPRTLVEGLAAQAAAARPK